MTAPAHKFVTLVSVGAGGSWAKGSTAEEAVERVVEIIGRDWGGIYPSILGASLVAPVWALEGLPNDWSLDGRGLYADNQWIEPVKLIPCTVPGKAKKRRARA